MTRGAFNYLFKILISLGFNYLQGLPHMPFFCRSLPDNQPDGEFPFKSSVGHKDLAGGVNGLKEFPVKFVEFFFRAAINLSESKPS